MPEEFLRAQTIEIDEEGLAVLAEGVANETAPYNAWQRQQYGQTMLGKLLTDIGIRPSTEINPQVGPERGKSGTHEGTSANSGMARSIRDQGILERQQRIERVRQTFRYMKTPYKVLFDYGPEIAAISSLGGIARAARVAGGLKPLARAVGGKIAKEVKETQRYRDAMKGNKPDQKTIEAGKAHLIHHIDKGLDRAYRYWAIEQYNNFKTSQKYYGAGGYRPGHGKPMVSEPLNFGEAMFFESQKATAAVEKAGKR